MAHPTPCPRLRSPFPVLNRWAGYVADYIDEALNISGMGVMRRPGIGTMISAATLIGVYLAYTTTTVTVATGTLPTLTPGTGTISLLGWNGTTTVATVTGQTMRSIFKSNVSGQTYGVASGKSCIVVKLFGVYWLITADC